MPMIGGEMAAETALSGRRVLADGETYDLGWVTDWLYGNAALPPAPLPLREHAHRHLAPVHAEPPAFADDVPARRATSARRGTRRGRRARQLALL